MLNLDDDKNFITGEDYTVLPTVENIESALHELLIVIKDEDERRVANPRIPAILRAESFAEICRTHPDVRRIDDLIENPVGISCREQVKLLGKILYRVTGSTNAMLETLERVAALDPANEGRRSIIMDKWWSGIGAGNDWWIA